MMIASFNGYVEAYSFTILFPRKVVITNDWSRVEAVSPGSRILWKHRLQAAGYRLHASGRRLQAAS
jgi:hypothetical protein